MSSTQPTLVTRLGSYQLLAICLAGAVTVVVSCTSAISFGYRSDDVHIALETAAILVSALAAFLIYGRFRHTGTVSELILSAALTLLVLANLARLVEPLFSEMPGDEEAVWVPLWITLLASGILAAAAFAPQRRLPHPERAAFAILGAVLAAGALILAAALLGSRLSAGIDPGLSPAASSDPRVVGAPALLAIQLTAMALLIVASAGFTLRARASGDELLGWLAVAATIGAFTRLNYFLFPSVYSHWVFTGDFMRLVFYLLILAGALRQISAYQTQAAEAAVLEERRRVARDLHDGLAQDLAFISMHASELSRSEARVAPIADAAEHALADSRGAIAALGRPADEALGVSAATLARALTKRSGADVKVDVDEGIETSHERREGVLRILSESISNAIRHGGGSEIIVRLKAEPYLCLTVKDDGSGFDPDAIEADGFGLSGIRERVERLGGEFRLRTRPGEGTEVEVMLP